MPNEAPTCTLIVQRLGTAIARHPLKGAVVSIGREATNGIVLADPSVSRQHAELRTAEDGSVRVVDLQSRNGIKVNGVPRADAALFDGDVIEVGAFTLKFHNRFVPAASPVRADIALAPADEQNLTVVQRPALPDPRDARHLSTLYHACFWATEGLDESSANARMLQLLLEGFRANEVQLYSAAGKLEASERTGAGKPGMKFAPYLAERCALLAEATPYTAAEMARFQQRSGRFHYLVAPLREPSMAATDKAPFVAILRADDCEPFGREDRVLLQAVSQVWARGTMRGRQLGALRHENARLQDEVRTAATAGGTPLLGTSPAIVQLRTRLQKVANTQAPVLLLGETGSGKEVAAQFVHYNSPRSKNAFVKVNCAAIPSGLIESELFGHVRGAFTDAKADRAGKFQQAHGGTLFLDEVGELPPEVQSKLLRAIESGEIQRLGSEDAVKVDVRIVAATNRDLAMLVQSRQFREDLYYRLNVFAVRVPPLREHVDDLPELAAGFLERFCTENGLAALRFAPKAFAALKAHNWPGNVRELRNIVQRCALETNGSTIGPEEVAAVLPAKAS